LTKLFIDELLRGNNHWLSVYPRAWKEWRKIRKQYAGLKISPPELAAMQKAIAAPVLPAGS
jgi:hypothetical protein